MLAPFAIATFLSAALLFVVEPMFARMILPLLGGAPAVWNTCVVFYQVMLLAGYLYAHLLATRLRLGAQLGVHTVVVVAAGAFLPIAVDPALTPPASSNPSGWVFQLLLVTLGAPFFVVATTGPLLQRWFAHTASRRAANPYLLYVASNIGSLLALLAYPIVMEPALRLRTQSVGWAMGYGVFAATTLACGALAWRRGHAPSASDGGTRARATRASTASDDTADDRWSLRLRWLGLATVPSSLLLSVTTFISTDVASVPLLWIVPLALYLLTFIAAFADRQIIPRPVVARLLPVAAIVVVGLVVAQNAFPVVATVAWHLLAFFVIALGCHQELSSSRPPAARLTEFYLWLSAGGALGGLLNTLVAPLVFVNAIEYPLAAVSACLLLPVTSAWPSRTAAQVRAIVVTLLPVVLMHVAIALVRAADDRLSQQVLVRYSVIFLVPLTICYAMRRSPVRMGLALASLVFAGGFVRFDNRIPLHIERTFFGVHRVMFTGQERLLQNGTTNHGAQSTNPALRCEPLTYYSRGGPVGEIFALDRLRAPDARVGVVGLGTATMAAYARPGQRWTFFEINPAIDRIARDPAYFTFVRDCGPEVGTMLGDARLSLQREPAASFDLLVLDAFSSDAIPVHLMTREAISLYLTRLKPGGLLALHISNRYLELAPVVGALARDAGGAARMRLHAPSAEQHRLSDEVTASRWTVMAPSAAALAPFSTAGGWEPITQLDGPVWTDDYSDVFRLIRWR